jgi:hypothetical protein
MRRTSNSVVQTVSIELDEKEIADLVQARKALRLLNESELAAEEYKAIENSIYLISTILGSHQ